MLHYFSLFFYHLANQLRIIAAIFLIFFDSCQIFHVFLNIITFFFLNVKVTAVIFCYLLYLNVKFYIIFI